MEKCPLCRSLLCALRSQDLCMTLHKPREPVRQKQTERPPRDTAVHKAGVTK